MLPSVMQQLISLRDGMRETVIPAIPQADYVAIDRANTILATLDWFLESQNHLYRYEVLENHEYRQGLVALLDVARGSIHDEKIDAAQRLLTETGPSEDDAKVPLFDLEIQNMRLKRTVSDLVHDMSRGRNAKARKAKAIAASLSRQQSDRNRLLAARRGRGFDETGIDLSPWDLA